MAVAARLRLPTRHLPVLEGLLPVRLRQVPADAISGATLAALAIPEVMGYTRIAGTPVVTGLYTLLLPMALFALFGSSRHLVVGANSATAAILAGGLAGLAAPNSAAWVALAGLCALLAAGLLLIARLVRLGFLADFLSRTVLVGFLTGVGIQVALGELPGLLGLPGTGHGPVGRLLEAIDGIRQARLPVVLVAAAVIVVIVGARLVSPRIPGALIAAIGSIAASWGLALQARGVSVLGPVPSGIPFLGLPHVAWSLGLLQRLLPTAIAMTVVILAQSAATSRAYASRAGERFDENVDLVGLALANLGAALSGTFVVNGSPTKTQMVVSAGGRSQLAQLVTTLLVALVLLVLTRPLAYLPRAVLSAVVFLIGIELVDLTTLRHVLAVRPAEFAVAVVTAAVVVLVGVEQGILAAMVLSLFDHVRRGYRPRNAVLVADHGGARPEPVGSKGELRPGLLVYRFTHSMYYANAAQLAEEVAALSQGAHPRWFCFDMAAVYDVDYSAEQTLRSTIARLHRQGIRPVLAEVAPEVDTWLRRYGIVKLLGSGAIYGTVGDVVRAYNADQDHGSSPGTPAPGISSHA